jgi:7,8-dihydropterin-6-yl-methyl-4-(beta-D-ribofuranosyl)aminobenzene 5'-phosphate synthase
MKLTVLVDNNTLIDKYFYGEPALSFFIELDDKNILFDAGYSNIFIKNADKAKINLLNLDYVVISHGHNDHTTGLKPILNLYSKNAVFGKPLLIAHENAFKGKFENEEGFIGCPVSEDELSKVFKLNLTRKPIWLSNEVVFLGEIPRKVSFEPRSAIGCLLDTNKEDYLLDDSALAINTDKGIIIITGCSHSGIANICEYAKEICSNDKIYSVIGGLHLIDATDERLNSTINYLNELKLDSLYACHCTGFKAQCLLAEKTNIKEVGSGLEILF